jgi:hypothetical protein
VIGRRLVIETLRLFAGLYAEPRFPVLRRIRIPGLRASDSERRYGEERERSGRE